LNFGLRRFHYAARYLSGTFFDDALVTEFLGELGGLGG